MTTTLEILIGARAIVERGWSQRAGYRNASGHVCFAADATHHCPIAAILVSSHPVASSEKAIEALRQVTGQPNIVAWSDAPERTKAEVLEAFDEAIRRVKAGAP